MSMKQNLVNLDEKLYQGQMTMEEYKKNLKSIALKQKEMVTSLVDHFLLHKNIEAITQWITDHQTIAILVATDTD